MSETIKSEQKYVLWLKNSKNVFFNLYFLHNIHILHIYIFKYIGKKYVYIYIYYFLCIFYVYCILYLCILQECKTSIS